MKKIILTLVMATALVITLNNTKLPSNNVHASDDTDPYGTRCVVVTNK